MWGEADASADGAREAPAGRIRSFDPSDRPLPGFVVVERGQADEAVVDLRGEHDVSTAAEVSRALGSLVDAGRPVIVDLRRTQFADLSIVRTVLGWSALADRSAGRLVLVLPDEGPARLPFDLAGVLASVRTAGSRHEARRLLAAP